MKQEQVTTLRQTQKLSPLQIQTIKLIELPIMELEQRIKKELEENPILDDTPQEKKDETEEETPRDVSLSEMKDDDPTPSYMLRVNNSGPDEKPHYDTFSVRQSFNQSMMEQLGYLELDDQKNKIGTFIIGSLDEGGYLRRDIESLVDDIEFRAGIKTNAEEVEEVLSIIQKFDPPGVGARDLRECLLLQLRAKTPSDTVNNAIAILEDYFGEFCNKHYEKIMARLGLSDEELKKARKLIGKLNPNPGGQVDDSYNDQTQQIVPDFKLEYENGVFNLTMPRFSIPEIRVNKRYAELLQEAANSSPRERTEAAKFVKDKMDSAKWFVEALKQRHNTLYNTMKEILDFQKEYFIDGDETHLKPMVLKDIAERTGFDISTISRVVNSKWIETHFGIFPLKHFFSEGLPNMDGVEVSTKELKNVLQELVDSEDKKNPLTDDQLVTKMNEKGYKVARRTIAKYRDQLGIQKARLRREL